MSKFVTVDDQGGYLYVNYDLSKLFLWDNRYSNGLINNSTYVDAVYNPGQLLGRVTATGYLVPFSATANDGSQFIVGVLNEGQVVPGGETVEVAYCVGGDVAADQLLFTGDQTLETIITTRTPNVRVKDAIQRDAAALRVIYGQDLSFPDNY